VEYFWYAKGEGTLRYVPYQITAVVFTKDTECVRNDRQWLLWA